MIQSISSMVNTTAPKAYLYARVSSDKQLLGTSQSIQIDEDTAKSISKRYGCEWSGKVYQDDGKSAYTGENLKHGELKHLIDDIECGIIKRNDLVIMRSLDRFSRADINKAVSIFTGLLNKGVRFYTTIDSRMYDDTQKDINPILATLAFRTANEESLKKSALMNSYILKRIGQFKEGKRGEYGAPYHLGGSVPFHCQLAGTDKNRVVVPHPANFEVAKEIIQLALKGWGLYRLRNHLNEKYNILRTKQALTDYLKSPSLYGRLTINVQDRSSALYDDEYKDSFIKNQHVLENYYPAVCTEEEFHALQYIRKSASKPKSNGKFQTLLSGRQKLFCGCGQPLSSNHMKNQGAVYYVCIDDKCGNLEQIRVLNAVIADCITSDIVIKSRHEANEVEELKINSLMGEIEVSKEKLREFIRLVSEQPKTFGDMLGDSIIKEKNIIDRLSIELNEIKGKSHSNEMQHAEYDSLVGEIRSIKNELIDGNSAQNLKNGDLVFKIVKRIIMRKDGLITITIIDDSIKYFYFPIQNKSTGRRLGTYLNIFNDVNDPLYQSMKSDPNFSKITYTVQDIANNKHVCKLEDIHPDLLRPYSHPRTMYACDKLVLQIVEFIDNNGFFILKKSFAIENGLTEKQWQKHKSYIERHFDQKRMIRKIDYVTVTNWKTSIKVILSGDDLDFELIMRSNIDNFGKLK